MPEEETKTVVLGKDEIVVPQKTLADVLAKQAELEVALENERGKREGLEAMFAKDSPDTTGEKKLRERKNFEPAFRTVSIKKYPIKGDPENLGYVIGWTNRGAYQKVNRDGVAPVIVDYIDIIFMGAEREGGKLQAESVLLLDLINASEVNCKVIETKDYQGKPFRLSYPATGQGEQKLATGEEISISTFDPKHGLVSNGETIDGWVGFTDLTYVIQIPGVAEPFEIDSKFVNI